MRRSCAGFLPIVVLAGCGSSGSPPAEVHALRSWRISESALIPHVRPVAPGGDRVSPRARPVPRQSAPSGSYRVAPGAPSDAEVRAELAQLYGKGSAGGAAGVGSARTVSLAGGVAIAPPDAPAKVQSIVAAANQVAKLPYVYGGGHGGQKGEGIWVDSAYDCSGSISFALASAGLVKSPLDSTLLAKWGKPGRGRWVTVYANSGHTFMVIGGARFDTVGLRQSGSRWQPAYRSISGFAARHPAGL